ncbi:hypothetical protein PILCRDRAFT_97521 [Piloderma croceum F 1598]|uniref:G domain-containing protein n=1 Tax=Piloderma croceum (strain F 1598) TaxID=765440 RepID=A0A0C3FTY6_PILCF|nr:hypothetical protein PILCRDRAFT_97521 [Piloderma croceum F 1598]
MFSSLRSKFKTQEEERARQIRNRCNRFRILIIGRANAGKTTILQKVCNTTEKPVIYNSKGKKSNQRGLHDITNEMVFKSNPGFIFHDSRGFEAGGTNELNNVKAFITARSENKYLQDQVHAIWYCIPLDDSRPFTKAEINFFSECGTGSVPVIVVFTKFDALEMKAYQDLLDEDHPREEAKAQASNHALESIKGYVESLYKKPHPPKSHVYLRDMYKLDANCHELTKQTAAVINDDTLQLLFVSTQRNNLELCVEYSIKQVLLWM